MNIKDYILPIGVSIIFLGVTLIFSSNFSIILKTKDISTEIFTFSSTLFGLVLTAYAILFGILPVMSKSFKQSQTVSDINQYFRMCLYVLVLHIIISFSYILFNNYTMFVINSFFLGADIGFFIYIISLINTIFEEIKI